MSWAAKEVRLALWGRPPARKRAPGKADDDSRGVGQAESGAATYTRVRPFVGHSARACLPWSRFISHVRARVVVFAGVSACWLDRMVTVVPITGMCDQADDAVLADSLIANDRADALGL